MAKRKLTKVPKEEPSTLHGEEYWRVRHEELGGTWDLKLIIDPGIAGGHEVLATVTRFKKYSDLKPSARNKVIAIAHALGAVLEAQGKLRDTAAALGRSGKATEPTFGEAE